MVSLTILALGVPWTPYAITNAIVLHRPAGLTPEHASASFSRDLISVSETALAWCPHVLTEKPDPVYNFLAFLEIRAILDMFAHSVLSFQPPVSLDMLGFCFSSSSGDA